MEPKGAAGDPSFLTERFDEPVLFAPARRGYLSPCHSLKVVTAFTDCDRIATHAIALCDEAKASRLAGPVSIEILLGMTKSSLSVKKHNDISRLLSFLRGTRHMPRISCRYICRGAEVHSKVYVWCACTDGAIDVPHVAYCGSLNYTTNAFYKRREAVCRWEPAAAYAYYRRLLPDTVDCFDPSAIEKVQDLAKAGAPGEADEAALKDYAAYDRETPVDTLTVSLLRADGVSVGYGSGINWGIRPNGTRRDPNQASIPYNARDRKAGFFPERTNPLDTRENCPVFKVITKDFGSFHMRLAQANNKALHAAESNAIIGAWLRKRLCVPPGGFITRRMLENDGRTFATFRKYADGTCLLDFRPPRHGGRPPRHAGAVSPFAPCRRKW